MLKGSHAPWPRSSPGHSPPPFCFHPGKKLFCCTHVDHARPRPSSASSTTFLHLQTLIQAHDRALQPHLSALPSSIRPSDHNHHNHHHLHNLTSPNLHPPASHRRLCAKSGKGTIDIALKTSFVHREGHLLLAR